MFNCLHSFRTKSVLDNHEKLCDDNEYTYSNAWQENKILTYLENNKSEIIPYVIYANFEYLLMKKDSSENNPNNSYTEKKAAHIPCGYSINLVSSFDSNKNEQWSFYTGNDCTINFSRKLKEICSKIFESGEQVNNLILTKEQNEYYDKQDKCHICLKEFNNLVMMIKKW